MKKSVWMIFLVLFCMFAAGTGSVSAEEMANCSIHNGKVVFRIKDGFEIAEEEYKLLLFTKTALEDRDVWVCVYDEELSREELEADKNIYIEEAPLVDNAAVRLYENSEGEWEDCFGLIESRMNASRSSYEITFSESKRAQDKTEKEALYILSDREDMLLPLSLAEELYDFQADLAEESVLISGGELLFSEDPLLFTGYDNQQKGLRLEACAMEAALTKSSLADGNGTRPGSETEAETKPELETEADTMPESETEEREETKSELEPEKGADIKAETEAETENEESQTEAVTEEAVTEQERLTQTESVTEETAAERAKQEILAQAESVTEETTAEQEKQERLEQTESLTEEIQTEQAKQERLTQTEVVAEEAAAEQERLEQTESETEETETEQEKQERLEQTESVTEETQTEQAKQERPEQTESVTEETAAEQEKQERLAQTESVTEETAAEQEKQERLASTESVTEEIQTEQESQAQTGVLTEEMLTERKTEDLSEETETQKRVQSEPETEGETAERHEPEGGSFYPAVVLASAVLILAAGVCVLIFGWNRNRKSAVMHNSSEDDADTIDPGKTARVPEKKVTVQGAVANSKGRVRKNNEDNFYFNGIYIHRDETEKGVTAAGSSQDPVQLYAVCDGMGGADAGEEASYRAVKELLRRKQEHQKMMQPAELTSVLRSISGVINEEANQRGQKSGTTIVLMLVSGGRAVFANVGDSRIYRFRDQKLAQISVDHSRVQRMVSMGILTPEQAKTDPARHVITQYLGMPADVKVSPYIVSEEELRKNDVYILCSDGLTDMVDDSEIEAVLKENKKPQEAVQSLYKAAMTNGGRDNVTIMLLRIQGNLGR